MFIKYIILATKITLVISFIASIFLLVAGSPALIAAIHGSYYIKSETEKSQFTFFVESAEVNDGCLYIVNPTFTNKGGQKIEVYGRGLASYLRTDVSYLKNRFVKMEWKSIVNINGNKIEVSSYRIIASKKPSN